MNPSGAVNFIWHLRGSVRLKPAITNVDYIRRIEHFLERQRTPLVERSSASIAFDDPHWNAPFKGNWRSLIMYDRGRFWIDEGTGERRLRYDLRSLHFMVFCIVAACMAFLFGRPFGDLLRAFRWAGVAFAWLYGGNLMIAVIRVPLTIRSVLEKASPHEGKSFAL